MSHYRDVVARMAVDGEFARHVRANPDVVAQQFGLTPEETHKLRGLADAQAGAGPELLGARLSKSGLGGGAVIGALGDIGSLTLGDPDPIYLQLDPNPVPELELDDPDPDIPPLLDPGLFEPEPPVLDLPPFVLDPDLFAPPDGEPPAPEPPAPPAEPPAPPVVNVDVQVPPADVVVVPDAAPPDPVLGQTTGPAPAAAPDSGDGSSSLAVGVAGAAGAVAGVAAAAAAVAAAKAARERKQEG